LLGWPAKIVESQGFREFTSWKPYQAGPQAEILLCRKTYFFDMLAPAAKIGRRGP
jgi:hypothetical protein